jgi:hypothetical protein
MSTRNYLIEMVRLGYPEDLILRAEGEWTKGGDIVAHEFF